MPNPYTGNPSTFHPTINYPADGDDADEASTNPLEQLLDNDAFLKAEVENSSTGLTALNNRVDALAVMNFPFDTLRTILGQSTDSQVIYDFDYNSTAQQYVALVFDVTTSHTFVYYSPDLKQWTKDSVSIASGDHVLNLVVGSSPSLAAGAWKYNATNLQIVKWVKGTGLTVTTTAIGGAGGIQTNPHSGAYFNSTFFWGLCDDANNAVVLSSTDLVSVNRQAFGVLGDLNHIRGPMVLAKSPSILVMIGGANGGFIQQNNSFFLTTTDGITFTERVFPAKNAGNETFGGISYNEDNGTFYAAASKMNAGGGAPLAEINVYQSTDGINWSLLKSIANPRGDASANQVTGIAAAGNTLLMTIAPAASTNQGPHTWLYSPDLGATWKVFPKFSYPAADFFFDTLWSKLRSDNGQIVHGNSNHVMGSLTLGEQGTAVT